MILDLMDCGQLYWYNLLRYFMDFCFSSLGRATYCELERHCISSKVCWIRKVLSRVSMWTSNFLSSRKKALVVGV